MVMLRACTQLGTPPFSIDRASIIHVLLSSPLQRSCWSDERLGSWARLNWRLCLTRLRERVKSEWKTKQEEEEARDWKEVFGRNRKGWMPGSIGSSSSQVPQTWPPTSTTLSSRATSGCGAGSWGWVDKKCRIDKSASDWFFFYFFFRTISLWPPGSEVGLAALYTSCANVWRFSDVLLSMWCFAMLK